MLEKKGIQYKNGTIFYTETNNITNERTIAIKYFFNSCMNSISLDRDMRILNFTSTCATDLSIVETTDDFNKILSFIENLNLSKTNYIELFFDGKFTRLEYLTRYLNYNSSWSGDDIISSKEHKKRVHNQILESKIYNPITNLLKNYGCQMTLNSMSDYFGEYTKRHLKKEQLIKIGMFTKAEANKKVYHGMEWLVFKLQCD
jgi:hypothetical protein